MARRVEIEFTIKVYPDNEKPKEIINRSGPYKLTRTLDGETAYQTTIELAQGASDTLWDASANPVSNFKWLIIDIDPDDNFANDDINAAVEIDFTADGVDSPGIVVRKEAPLIFSSADAGGPNTGAINLKTIDGKITKIRVNDFRNQTGISHFVRITILK